MPGDFIATAERCGLIITIGQTTGVSNPRAFDEILLCEWQRALRDSLSLSLLLLDVDHFERFTDRYGQRVGNDCLRSIALILQQLVRATDSAARYASQQLAVVLPDTDLTGARLVAEKIRSSVEALCLLHEDSSDSEGEITISVGVVTAVPRLGGTVEEQENLLRAAADALHKAKERGHNQVVSALPIVSVQDGS